jgi:hypothetical protein
LLALTFLHTEASAQYANGSYQGTVPEACLMFLNPGYLNPARGQGALGISANPAALYSVKGTQAAVAFGLPESSEGNFTFRVSDSSLAYGAIDVEAGLKLKEMGGLAGLGIAQQYRRWRFGVALFQPRRGGVAMRAGGDFVLQTHFQVQTPIPRQMVPDLPVEEIPVSWDVTTRVEASFAGGPGELSLSVLPVAAAVSYTLRPLTLGVGLTYYRLSTSGRPMQFRSHISGEGVVTGTPGGIDPLTNQPWWGTLQGYFSLEDDPICGGYKLDLRGDRFAASVGANLALGPLSLGATYTRGFPTTLHGSYELRTVRTIGPPADVRLPQVSLSWANRPQLTGQASLLLANFEKDSVVYRDEGELRLRGSHSIAAGLHLFVLGVFGGMEMAQDFPDLSSAYVGVYLDVPLPWLPVRLNAGVLQRADAVQTEHNFFAPFRVISHLGAGVAVRLPLARWLALGTQPSWLRIGVRSSLTSVALKLFTEKTEAPEKQVLPKVTETLALGMGLDFPF